VRQDAGRCGTAYSDRLALVSRWARDHLDVSSVTGASVSESAPNTARPPLIPRPPLIGRPPFIAKPPPAGAEEVVLTPPHARINLGAHGRQVEQAPIKIHSTDRRDCIATAAVPPTTPTAPPPAASPSTPRVRRYIQEDVMQEHVMQQHHARRQEERESIHAAPEHKQTSHQVAGKSTCYRFSARTLSHVPPHWLTILVARVLSHDAMTCGQERLRHILQRIQGTRRRQGLIIPQISLICGISLICAHHPLPPTAHHSSHPRYFARAAERTRQPAGLIICASRSLTPHHTHTHTHVS